MSANTYYKKYFFHVAIPHEVHARIDRYIQSFPKEHWKKFINVSKNHQFGFLIISDGKKTHEIYENEL